MISSDQKPQAQAPKASRRSKSLSSASSSSLDVTCNGQWDDENAVQRRPQTLQQLEKQLGYEHHTISYCKTKICWMNKNTKEKSEMGWWLYILVTTVSFKELLVCIASIWGHRWDRQTFPFRPNRRSPSQQGCRVNPDMGDHHNEWRRWVFIYVYPYIFFLRCNIVQYEHYPMNIACTWHQQPRWTCFWDHQPALWKWPCTWCGSGRKKRWSIHRWKGYDVTQI